jgi:hypothetical protein
VEKDLRNLGLVNWKMTAQERDDWRKNVESRRRSTVWVVVPIVIIT